MGGIAVGASRWGQRDLGRGGEACRRVLPRLRFCLVLDDHE
jgi:hypothetical protein